MVLLLTSFFSPGCFPLTWITGLGDLRIIIVFFVLLRSPLLSLSFFAAVMHALPLLLVVLSLSGSVVVEVAGQASCVPYRGSPATGGKCDSVVTYSHILLLPGQTYAQVPHTTLIALAICHSSFCGWAV